MDYAGIPYTEEQDAGILGMFFFGRRFDILKKRDMCKMWPF